MICPKCHQNSITCNSMVYYCNNNVRLQCDFTIPKKINNTPLGDIELKKILQGEKIVKSLISNTGKPYFTYLQIINNRLQMSYKMKSGEFKYIHFLYEKNIIR